MRYLLFLGIFVTNVICMTTGFAVCGDTSYTKEVDEATDEIIKRFMGYRTPDWGWSTYTSPMAIQVTVPERLFGREKTVKALEEKITSGRDKMSINTKAISALAAKSLCMNERNISGIDLIQELADHMSTQFVNNSHSPRDGLMPFAIGLSALCVSGYHIEQSMVDNLLRGQLYDGSFGGYDPLGITVKLLPPISCLRRLPRPSFDVKKVDVAVAKMREYIISNVVNNDAGEVYIGDKLTTSLGLIGLWISKNATDDPARWRCRAAVMTLGLYPDPSEREYLLIWRLLRLHGRNFVDMADPGWKCIKPDPIPEGYVPTCVHDKPETCEAKPDPK